MLSRIAFWGFLDVVVAMFLGGGFGVGYVRLIEWVFFPVFFSRGLNILKAPEESHRVNDMQNFFFLQWLFWNFWYIHTAQSLVYIYAVFGSSLKEYFAFDCIRRETPTLLYKMKRNV